MQLVNSTHLSTARLLELFERFTAPYRHDRLVVRVRFSRGADFSGSCFYTQARMHINLGRSNRYPYTLGTHVAPARSTRGGWRREVYRLTVPDPYQLVLFVYLHELYHYLVAQAGRSPRRREGMCDRFATRVLVDEFGCSLRDARGRIVPRDAWDIRDVHALVARAPRQEALVAAARRTVAVLAAGRGWAGGPPASAGRGLGNPDAGG